MPVTSVTVMPDGIRLRSLGPLEIFLRHRMGLAIQAATTPQERSSLEQYLWLKNVVFFVIVVTS